MFEKLSQAAEHMATNVSRRQFLGRFAAGALALATALGGLLALPDLAEAAPSACGPRSWLACIGKKPGDRCNVTYHIGVCAHAPICACLFTKRRGDR